MNTSLRFIDLFAGLGGFHHALVKAGGYECVFACEIDPRLRELYEFNHGIKAEGDIATVRVETIPRHDVLCAGFPCQPFSIAGSKKGTSCPKSGRLIQHVFRIARYSRPEFIVLENVPGLMTVANGSVWRYIRTTCRELGYDLVHKVVSPLDIGIPQNRKRLFIVASQNHDLTHVFDLPYSTRDPKPLHDFLDNVPSSYKKVAPQKRIQLEKWQQLLTDCTLPAEMPNLSILAPEFGATYPLDYSGSDFKHMDNYRGAYGEPLEGCSNWNESLARMPSYWKRSRRLPNWLLQSVIFSRKIYNANKVRLDRWHSNLDKRFNSWQILEWRGERTERLISEHLVQFRASGIRVATQRTLPSLVAMTTTQVPIIGSQMRYLSRFEAARFQDLHELKQLPHSDSFAFRAIGNAVNAKIVAFIASNIRSIHQRAESARSSQ